MELDLMKVGRIAGPPIALFAWGVAWWAAFNDGPQVALEMGVLALSLSAPVPFFYINHPY